MYADVAFCLVGLLLSEGWRWVMGLCRFFYRIFARVFSLPLDGDLGSVPLDGDRNERFRRLEANGG